MSDDLVGELLVLTRLLRAGTLCKHTAKTTPTPSTFMEHLLDTKAIQTEGWRWRGGRKGEGEGEAQRGKASQKPETSKRLQQAICR